MTNRTPVAFAALLFVFTSFATGLPVKFQVGVEYSVVSQDDSANAHRSS